VPRGSGLRFAVEATFLVAVAVIAVMAHFHWPAIILVMVLAWILVSAVEVAISRRGAAPRVEPASGETERAVEVDIPQHVRVIAADPAPAPKPEPPPPPAPVVVVEVEEPVPVVVPVPVPVAPVLVSVPAPPPPAPEPVRAPEPAAPSVVTIASRDTRPREWNLWELERLTREGSGSDPAVDEERNYLLMYLREFANADGALPVDFDGLVRDSFGELIGVA
jgi:outer membrane biosynthesis protein TonB